MQQDAERLASKKRTRLRRVGIALTTGLFEPLVRANARSASVPPSNLYSPPTATAQRPIPRRIRRTFK